MPLVQASVTFVRIVPLESSKKKKFKSEPLVYVHVTFVCILPLESSKKMCAFGLRQSVAPVYLFCCLRCRFFHEHCLACNTTTQVSGQVVTQTLLITIRGGFPMFHNSSRKQC